ncbi:MAG TPA: M20 family metallo-hydrolase [Solirubrobacteraceae bacterium]|nr:M20 family metallo-hydrolase [Solirubrobacteraceae bacterium]
MLHERIERLAEINSERGGRGITREVYTPEYVRAVEFVAEAMGEAGLDTRLDSVGSLFGRWVGTDPEAPRVLTGSHFDTTLNAGRFDGVLGVLGAIEAVRELRRAGVEPRRTIEVVGIAGEEPRFGAGCIGSRAMVGALTREQLDDMRDRDGVSVTEAMRERGFDPDRLDDARLDADHVHAFVELHIEQGAVLETSGEQVGVVERIAAPHDLRVSLRGSAMHAGATPMRLRRDALAGASEVVLELERLALASASATTVATVGVLRVEPGAVNVIPGQVEMDVDVRDSDLAARERVIDALRAKLEETASRRGLELTVSTLVRDDPAACSPLVVEAVRAACQELDVRYLNMTSGAYHDAMVLGARLPMGMIFVPSVGGLSHHPDEYTHAEDIDRGVQVLAGTLARLAR